MLNRASRALALAFLLAGAAPSLANADTTFTYTGSEQTYTVPAGVTQLQITAVGGQGGGFNYPGGYGANVADQVSVTPGETLYVEVGGNGANANGGTAAGGFNGGGTGYYSAGGGGASDVRTVSSTSAGSLASRIVVAGGGGGSGTATAGGSGGVTAGSGGSAYGTTGGSGATTSGPGAGSAGGSGATGGTSGSYPGGGAGGGGYYGGGAGNTYGIGSTAGGGAGSSWSANGTATITTDTTGVPEVTIAVVPVTPTNLTAPSVSGSDEVGATLTASPGTWLGPASSVTYQWQRCNSSGTSCANIPGATSVTYTPTASVAGGTLEVVVTATNTAGSASVASSVTGQILSAPINQTAPSVTGSPKVGDTLTATAGSWSGSPTGYQYQWLDCDSSGATCVSIPGATSATYTLVAADAGHTVQVQVTAENGVGWSTPASSAVTAAVTAAASADTGNMQGYAVTVPAPMVSTGLQATAQGMVDVTLQCPQIVPGVCNASGTLSIALNGKQASDRRAEASQVLSSGVIAQFAGLQVQAGQEQLVATHLTPAAIAYLRAHGIYRVRVLLQTTNTLTDGQIVRGTQETWLYVPGLTGCHAAAGSVSSAGVGALRLGMSRRRAHRTGHFRRTANGFEHYCYAGGGIRIAYSSPAVAGTDGIPARHVALVLTGNRHFAVKGVRAGTTLTLARRHLKLGPAVVLGKNTWYFIPGRKVTQVLKVHNGVVREIGVALATATETRAQAAYLLRHLK
jgi:hypothetical protein